MKTVMVVDDEESLRLLSKGIIENAGFKFMQANDGKECLEILKTKVPDLILMDMMMPGLTGRETVEKIRKNPKTKNIKIFFLTVARFSETGLADLKKLEILEYITKPFENAFLVEKIKNTLK